MSLERSLDDASYGELLGEYITVVAEVGRTLDEFGRPREEDRQRYERLRERKSELRDHLEEAERDESPDDYRAILENALPAE